MPSLHIIFASTSGHTEYVVSVLQKELMLLLPDLRLSVQKAEQAEADDFQQGDVLLLASSTWNTGSKEGQLNPHMFFLLMDKAKDVSLKGRNVAVIGLGDERYRYKARAADHMTEFVASHDGVMLLPAFRMVNEPYGQEEAVKEWAEQLRPYLEEKAKGKKKASKTTSSSPPSAP